MAKARRRKVSLCWRTVRTVRTVALDAALIGAMVLGFVTLVTLMVA